MSEHIIFLTGKLAKISLEKVLSDISKKMSLLMKFSILELMLQH